MLDAQVVCIRREGGRPWTAPPGLTFREWVRNRRPRMPTVGDLRTTQKHGDPWLRAAGDGLTDPVIAPAAKDCFLAARAALVRGRNSDHVVAMVDAFMERYAMWGRSPADDLRDAFVRGAPPSVSRARHVPGPSDEE